MRSRGESGRGRAKPVSTAYDKALGLLARREHSRRELKTRLDRSGHAREEADAALDALSARNHQNDTRFAQMLARSRAGAGYGPRRIHAELRTHGIPEAEIAGVLAELDIDWQALAAEQLRRKHGQGAAPDFRERARRAAFLLRRGFDAATVSALTRSKT